jgi:hypothetical protein
MPTTEVKLDLQSDKVMTDPRIQGSIELQDYAATNRLTIDWAEPATADRTLTLPDPGGDDDFVYANAAQTLSNKSAPDPTVLLGIANKGYVDAAVAGATITDATSAPGGGVKGKVTADENLGLQIVAGVLEVKVDGVTTQLNGAGQIQSIGGGGGGAITADASYTPDFVRDITGVTPTTVGTIGTDTETFDFPKFVTSGQKFEWTVPDDYAGGDAFVFATYAMSAAGGGAVRTESQIEVFNVLTGAITLVPAVAYDLTVPATTNVVKSDLYTMSAANLKVGNKIQVFVKRYGSHVNDTSANTWKVIAFSVRYTSVISNRVYTHYVETLRNTDEAAPTPGAIGTDTLTEDFATGADNETKFSLVVPENWDETSNPAIRVNYAMSSAAAGTVRLATEGEILNTVGGTIDAVTVGSFDITPPVATSIQRSLIIRELPATTVHRGDSLTIKLARRTGVGGNHSGNFKLLGVTVSFGVVSATGSGSAVDEKYLTLGIFNSISETGTYGDTAYPDFAGDFSALDRLVSEVASGQIHVAYSGRLGPGQTQISYVRIFIKGVGTSPQYRLRVYVEGSGATPAYTTGYLSAPGTLTETLLTNLDISPQPTGSKRYHVVVEAYLDVDEEVHVSRPFVRQE